MNIDFKQAILRKTLTTSCMLLYFVLSAESVNMFSKELDFFKVTNYSGHKYHEFKTNNNFQDYFKVLKENQKSVILGGRNNLYHLSLPNLKSVENKVGILLLLIMNNMTICRALPGTVGQRTMSSVL